MKRSAWLVISAATIALGLAVSLGGGFVRSAASQPREVTFIDLRNGFALRLQVEPSVPNAGAFVFRVPGRGVYVGTAGTSMQVLSQANVVVQFQGPATLRPDVGLTNASGAGAEPRAVTITLQAVVDPTSHTAQATLVDGLDAFQLLVLPLTGGDIGPTLQGVEVAVVQGDWATLYSYMNSDITRTNTPATFAQQMAQADAALGPIVALRRLAIGPVQTNDEGATSLVVGYEVDRAAASGTTTARYDASFLLQAGSWKLWYMETP